jgi:hypothetical protein
MFAKVLAALTLVSWSTLGVAQTPAPQPVPLSVAHWSEDLDFLVREMPKRHKNLFHDITRSQFEQAVDQLRQRLDKLPDLQKVAEFQKLGAMIRDAHTGISATTPELRFPALPLRLYVYDDGVFVQAAPPEWKALVGAKLTHIAQMPIEDVLERARAVTDVSNESTFRAFVVYRIIRPELLRAIGVVSSVDSVPMTFEIAGESKTLTLATMPRKADGSPSMGGISYAMGAAAGSGWIDARPSDPSPSPTPLYLQQSGEPYWFKHLSDRNWLYIKCAQVSNKQNGETLKAFFDRAYEEADRLKVTKVILDLRLNGGGDNTLLLPIVHGIVKRDSINQAGRLFVVIGRLTQSAAQNLTNLLETHTNATFIGEPTGERPNHYGESAQFVLPNSRLQVSVSTLWWQDLDPRDGRVATAPRISAPLSSKDYASNRDPVMAALMALD